MTPCSREKQKKNENRANGSALSHFSLELFELFSFDRSFVFHLAGPLDTAILANTIKVSYLRITQGT